MRTPSIVREFLSEIGSKGGRTTGHRKRRPKGHYKRIGRLGGIATSKIKS